MPRGPRGEKRPADILALGLSCLASACSVANRAPPPHAITADEALAVQSRVIDCEWKAANQYDDGKRTMSELARQVMGVCTVELTKARLAFGFSPSDPSLDAEELQGAITAIEDARKARSKQ